MGVSLGILLLWVVVRDTQLRLMEKDSEWVTEEPIDLTEIRQSTPLTNNDASMDVWRTYNNTVYGVSFRYPSNFDISKCAGEYATPKVDGTEKECVYIYDKNADPSEVVSVDLDFEAKPSNQDFATYLNVSAGELTNFGGKLAHISIVEASKYNTYRTKRIFIEISNSLIARIVGPYDSDASRQIVDLILSTFKFSN